MLLVLALGVTLGVDSLRVCAVLGLGNIGRCRWALPIAFGICDGLAVGVGIFAADSFVAAVEGAANVAAAVALAGYGCWLTLAKDEPTGTTVPAWLPVLMGMDNLGAGLALNGAAHPVTAAVTMGTISALMALVGLRVGTAVAARIPSRTLRRAAGLTLVALAALTLTSGA